MFEEDLVMDDYETTEELLEEMCGCDADYSLDDFFDAWDPS